VPAGGSQELSVLLEDYCGGRGFDEPGLLLVRPQLDTRKASGADIGLRTFDGQVAATAPVVVRLHQGRKPPHLQRPHVEPLPSAAPSSSAAPAASASAGPAPSESAAPPAPVPPP
jgi:hypothetical protein